MMWRTVWGVRFGQILHGGILGFGSIYLWLILGLILWQPKPAIAETLAQSVPSQASITNNDVPEEVLRAEIYTDAHSPVNGARLTAAEYTILMENLGSVDYIPPEQKVSKRLRNVVELLKLRQQVRSIAPFLLK
ncbi:MAG: hypothetical protein ACK456_13505 [Pseudanabaenaceae cyanobacterium]|jgi:hypothetical protein